MAEFGDYDQYDAVGLAKLVQQGDVSPGDVLESAISRAEKFNPAINAIVDRLYDLAKAAIKAGLPAGPFRGVPWLLKDLGTCLDGTRTTFGSALFKDNVADHDSGLIRRYKEAGLVIFGKTATPEFGLTTSTESALFGPTRNPWGLEHTSGGSSGGSSAAVAAGIVPAADGSDGGGSVRIPASCCGLVGLKPTRARISAGPDRGEGWSGMSTSGVITRTVRDTAALLDVCAGRELGDPYSVPAPERPFAEEAGAEPGALRIAWHAKPFNGSECHADCKAAVEDAAKICGELGHRVEHVEWGVDVERLNRAVRIIVGANTRRTVDDRLKQLGRDTLNDGDLEPLTRGVYDGGARYNAADYVFALNAIHACSRAVAGFFEKYDVMLTPTLGVPPQKLGGALSMSGPDRKVFAKTVAETVGFTQFFNVTGTPAISLPLFWNAAGLPIGTQFASAYGQEALLIRLAAQLGRARPWGQRRPALG